MKTITLMSIDKELINARSKFPYHPDDLIHSAAIVAEESGELIKSALELVYEKKGTNDDIRKEALHVIVTAIRLLEECDYVRWERGNDNP